MSWFFLAYLCIYGWMNLYLLHHLKAFGPTRRTKWTIAALLGAMILAPLLVRGLERAGCDALARPVAVVGYVWMGFIFLFFVVALLVNLGIVAVVGWRLLLREPVTILTPARRRQLAALAVALTAAVTAYGLYEANTIRTEPVRIATPKLAAERVRIAQISDVHLSVILGESRLRRILAVVEQADPDILVSTGDLVDGELDGATELAARFAAVKPRYGKYAVTGNHELYAGLDQALAFTRAAGFTVLRGEAVEPGGLIRLAGVDDIALTGREHGWSPPGTARLAGPPLALAPSPLYTVLLKHRPVISPVEDGVFDLQLSGHVHGGQLFPFGLVPRAIFGYLSGLYPLRTGGLLYVNRGTGTWGPPLRVLAPPEVTIIDIVREEPE